jgi:hypothetical protein
MPKKYSFLSSDQYQDPDYVPQDLSFDSDEDRQYENDREAERKERSRKSNNWRKLIDSEYALKQQYLQLRHDGLNHARAVQAVDPDGLYYKRRQPVKYEVAFVEPKPMKNDWNTHYKDFRVASGSSHERAVQLADKHYAAGMAAAKKYAPKKSGSKGVTKTTSKTTYTKPKAIDVAKLVKAGITKELNKNIETQHSYLPASMITSTVAVKGADGMTSDHEQFVQSGKRLSGLHMDSEFNFTTKNCFAFNISALSQVRPGTSAGAPHGWRNGYKIHAMSLRVDVRISVTDPTIDGKYYLWCCRKKDGIRPEYHTPSLQEVRSTNLFRPRYGGPFGDENALEPSLFTMDNKNTEMWSWPEGMRDEKSYSPVTRVGSGKHLHLSFYKKLDTVWEFSSDIATGAPSLKDGDYALFLFREGEDDIGLKKTTVDLSVDLAFKDC